MFKRTFWFTTGATAGFGGAMWVRRQVLRTVRRYTPEQVQAEVATSVRRFGGELREAVTEARRTMADREAQLREELRPGGGPVHPRGPSSPALPATPTGAGGPITATPQAGAAAAAPPPPDGEARRRGRRRARARRRGQSIGEGARHH